MKINVTARIFIGMVLGVIAGQASRMLYPDFTASENFANQVQILSDIFLRLIKMIIAPLVFSTLVVGVAKVGDFKSVGRIGLKTIVYFQFATLIALSLGLMIVNLFEPGKVMQLVLPMQNAASGVSTGVPTLREFISHVIPKSVIEAMANNEILPLVVFSLFFGIAANSLGSYSKPLIHALEIVSHVMFKVTAYVMAFAPFGVFGAIAAVVAKQGVGIISGYFYLIACFYAGLIFFAFIILGGTCLRS